MVLGYSSSSVAHDAQSPQHRKYAMKLYDSPGACSLSRHIVAHELGIPLNIEKGNTQLAPANGTLGRARLQEMLNYITSEIHKTYSPLFKDDTPEATREERKAYLQRRYEFIERILAKQQWLLGDHFTVADAYLF